MKCFTINFKHLHVIFDDKHLIKILFSWNNFVISPVSVVARHLSLLPEKFLPKLNNGRTFFQDTFGNPISFFVQFVFLHQRGNKSGPQCLYQTNLYYVVKLKT